MKVMRKNKAAARQWDFWFLFFFFSRSFPHVAVGQNFTA